MRRQLTLAFLLCVACVAAHAGAKEACDYSAQHLGVTCLVMVDGKIVHELYADSGRATERLRLASGTKSFSGAAMAAAVQDKLLTVDEKVSDTLNEWKADGRKDITIRQLLSLTSGIDTPAPGKGGRLTPEKAVGQTLVHPPGSTFAYGQAPYQVFAALMGRKLKDETYEKYLNRRILRPLGITLEFKPLGLFAPSGPDWAGGGAMSARDWATFGEFIRLGGKWNGQQLVDANALAECFRGSPVHPGYGLTWWLKPPKGASVPLDGTTQNATDFYHGGADALPVSQIWMAAGAGKQRLMVIPERNMVALRQTAQLLRGESEGYSDVEFARLLLN